MSETITEPEAPEPQVAPVETPEPQPEPQAEAPTEPAVDPEPKPEPKPKRTDRHIAHLTARAAEETRLREAAERRAEAAEALLRANRQGDDEPAPQHRQAPQDDEARIAQILQEREFTRRLGEIDTKGKTEIGSDAWEQAKATLTGLGAVNNQAFLQALAKSKAPERVFAALADDPDRLMDILRETPAGMGAILGEMGAELTRPAPAKPLSGAPTPATRVQTGAVIKDFDAYNVPTGMSMKAWNAEMDKLLPPSLGGKRKTA